MIQTILRHARAHLDVVQGDSKHKEIIDKYNAVSPLPVGYKVKYTDDWCAAFVTVIGDLSNASAWIGRECGVQRFVQLFKKKGIWLGVVRPQSGDIIVFDWKKDGWTDHIGIVEKIEGNTITTIEGNTQKRVARRTYLYNDWRIAGYARPKYPSGKTNPQKRLSNDDLAREVIAGKWSNGDARKARLTEAGYDPTAVQQSVNRLLASKPQGLKSNEAIAKEVISGKWGNGDARKSRLTEAGYDPTAVQQSVNRLLASKA